MAITVVFEEQVDMSPEDFFCHGTLKTEIVGVLYRRVKQDNLRHQVVDKPGSRVAR